MIRSFRFPKQMVLFTAETVAQRSPSIFAKQALSWRVEFHQSMRLKFSLIKALLDRQP